MYHLIIFYICLISSLPPFLLIRCFYYSTFPLINFLGTHFFYFTFHGYPRDYNTQINYELFYKCVLFIIFRTTQQP